MAALSAWFWSEDFWLPHNVSWTDLANPAPGVEYPRAGHLLKAFPLALGIFAVRIFFERYGSFLEIKLYRLGVKPALKTVRGRKEGRRSGKKGAVCNLAG